MSSKPLARALRSGRSASIAAACQGARLLTQLPRLGSRLQSGAVTRAVLVPFRRLSEGIVNSRIAAVLVSELMEARGERGSTLIRSNQPLTSRQRRSDQSVSPARGTTG